MCRQESYFSLTDSCYRQGPVYPLHVVVAGRSYGFLCRRELLFPSEIVVVGGRYCFPHGQELLFPSRKFRCMFIRNNCVLFPRDIRELVFHQGTYEYVSLSKHHGNSFVLISVTPYVHHVVKT